MTTTRYLSLTTRATALRDARQVKVVASTETVGRDGLVLVSAGIDLANYRLNPVVLWQHDADRPIAKAATIGLRGADLVATLQFPPEGASACADEAFALIGAGIVSGISIGFDPKAAEPLDKTHPFDGQRITECELTEISVVSIPALPDALIEERSRRTGRTAAGTGAAPDWKCGAASDLPLNDDPDRTWDADAARSRVFRWAGFESDHPDPVKARRAFLAYDASAPLLIGSYKLPFADVITGTLTAIRRGIDAAAQRLDATDIPEREKERARQLIKSYEAAEPDGPERAHRRRRAAEIERQLSGQSRSAAHHRRVAERCEAELRRGASASGGIEAARRERFYSDTQRHRADDTAERERARGAPDAQARRAARLAAELQHRP